MLSAEEVDTERKRLESLSYNELRREAKQRSVLAKGKKEVLLEQVLNAILLNASGCSDNVEVQIDMNFFPQQQQHQQPPSPTASVKAEKNNGSKNSGENAGNMVGAASSNRDIPTRPLSPPRRGRGRPKKKQKPAKKPPTAIVVDDEDGDEGEKEREIIATVDPAANDNDADGEEREEMEPTTTGQTGEEKGKADSAGAAGADSLVLEVAMEVAADVAESSSLPPTPPLIFATTTTTYMSPGSMRDNSNHSRLSFKSGDENEPPSIDELLEPMEDEEQEKGESQLSEDAIPTEATRPAEEPAGTQVIEASSYFSDDGVETQKKSPSPLPQQQGDLAEEEGGGPSQRSFISSDGVRGEEQNEVGEVLDHQEKDNSALNTTYDVDDPTIISSFLSEDEDNDVQVASLHTIPPASSSPNVLQAPSQVLRLFNKDLNSPVIGSPQPSATSTAAGNVTSSISSKEMTQPPLLSTEGDEMQMESMEVGGKEEVYQLLPPTRHELTELPAAHSTPILTGFTVGASMALAKAPGASAIPTAIKGAGISPIKGRGIVAQKFKEQHSRLFAGMPSIVATQERARKRHAELTANVSERLSRLATPRAITPARSRLNRTEELRGKKPPPTVADDNMMAAAAVENDKENEARREELLENGLKSKRAKLTAMEGEKALSREVAFDFELRDPSTFSFKFGGDCAEGSPHSKCASMKTPTKCFTIDMEKLAEAVSASAKKHQGASSGGSRSAMARSNSASRLPIWRDARGRLAPAGSSSSRALGSASRSARATAANSPSASTSTRQPLTPRPTGREQCSRATTPTSRTPASGGTCPRAARSTRVWSATRNSNATTTPLQKPFNLTPRRALMGDIASGSGGCNEGSASSSSSYREFRGFVSYVDTTKTISTHRELFTTQLPQPLKRKRSASASNSTAAILMRK